MPRFLRSAFAAAVALLCISQPARAVDYFQVPWGIKRGTTPSLVCITTGGDICLGQLATLNIATGEILQIGPIISSGNISGTVANAAIALSNAGGGTLFTPNGNISRTCYTPSNVVVEQFGPHVPVNEAAECTEGNTFASSVIGGTLAQNHAGTFLTLRHVQMISEGAGGSIATNGTADFSLGISALKKNWTIAASALQGEIDPINCSARNGGSIGPAAINDASCLLYNIGGLNGSGYHVGIEGQTIEFDPTTLLPVHTIGNSIGISSGRDHSYIGYLTSANLGVSDAAFYATDSASGSFSNLIKNIVYCAAVPYTNFVTRTSDAAQIWTPCGFPAGATTWLNSGGTQTLFNNSNASMLAVAQNGAAAFGSPTGGLPASAGVLNVVGLQINGTTLFANPTATIGLTAVNGTATTGIRSDGAPALSQAIVPTWTGIHTFSAAPVFSLGAKYSGSSSGTVTVLASATAGTPTITWGNASGTPAVSASAPLALSTTTGNVTCTTCVTSSGGGAITGTAPVAVSAAGAVSITGAAGQVLAGASPAFTATPTLGVAGSTVGSLALANATSGSVTLQPVTGALGSAVLSLPATTSTVAVTGNNLSVFAATTSAQLAGVISDETGSGALVFATSPTLVTPTLGVASATSINKLTITAPATSATLTIADGASLITSGAFATTLTATAATNSTLPSGTHTLAGLDVAQTFTVAQVIQAATSVPLTVKSTGATNAFIAIDNAGGGNQVGFVLEDASAAKWQFIKQIDNSFLIFDATGSTTILTAVINNGPLSLTPANNLILAPSGAHGVSVGSAADPGTGNLSVSGIYKVGATSGLSATKTVRASGGAADCTLIYTGGILTGGSC